MKKTYVLGLGLAIGLMSCSKESGLKSLDSEVDSLSYALGVDTSINLPKSFEGVSMDAFLSAIEETETDNSRLDQNTAKQIYESYVMEKQLAKMEEMKRERENADSFESEIPEVEPSTFSSSQTELLNKMDSVSYALGVQFYYSAKMNIPDINFEVLDKACKSVMDEDELLLNQDDSRQVIRKIMSKRQSEMIERQQKERQAAIELEYAPVKEEGLKFLAENAKREGVIVTDSGLQYEVVKKGNEVYPNAESNVTVHYVGTTPEGVIFDSSRERGEPTSFGLNQVIRGWTEGVQLMGEGAIYKFYIPQELAYGASAPQGSPIKPLMPLVFEVELISVNQ